MKDRAVIVTALANEAPYLLEWVAHHKALGFEGAVIFTNPCDDGTDRMAARLAELGLALHVPLEPKKNRDSLRHGLRGLPERLERISAKWAMVADIREFLNIRTEAGDLESLLAAVGPVDALSVCRKLFGSAGRRGIPDGSLRETYRQAAAENEQGRMVARGIKTLFRPERVARIAPHRPYFDKGAEAITWVDAGGEAMPAEYFDGKWAAHPGFSHRFARLHYYPVPSPEAFVIQRGVPEGKNHRKAMLDDWRKLNVNTETDDGMAGAIERSAPVLTELREDQALAELEKTGRAWHAARAEELLRDSKLAELCARMSNFSKGAEKTARRTAPRGKGGAYTPPPVRPVRFDVTPAANGQSHAVLHGGFHKTATTYLQRVLEDNNAWLGKQSVYVVPHQKLRKHITFPSQLDAYRALKIRRRTIFSEEELQGFSEAFFAEPLALRPARMILSDENIPGLPAHCVTTGGLYRYRKEFFRRFAMRLPLPVTEAFFAIRGYADFFASAYVEYLRSATSGTTGRMITPEELRRNVLATLPDWHSALRDFAEVFPETRIHVWRFEDFRALGPKILQLLCGEDVDARKLKESGESKARPTASRRAVEELVLISELEGAGVMSDRSKEVQERFPLTPGNDRFDPWTEAERAHFVRLYDQDWDRIRNDPRLTVLEP